MPFTDQIPVSGQSPPAIVVTASRAPELQTASAASVTLVDEQRITRLGEPLVATLLRLVPSAALSASGPAGSLTQLRIRGAEANHSLLLIDGIRANDPAAGNEPRFELLNADLASRIEVIRGPQSALWGSEAIGGVVAVDGRAASAGPADFTGSTEWGSLGFRRASAGAGIGSARASLVLGAAFQQARGIDSFSGEGAGGGGGDRDGYRNLALRGRGELKLAPALTLGASGFALVGRSEYDGYDPVTFNRSDTLDSTRNRLAAGRLWGDAGDAVAGRWAGSIGASLLGSSNRNLLDDRLQNRTSGRRAQASAQVQHRFTTGGVGHLLVVVGEAERERFRSVNSNDGGFSDQRRTRRHLALTGEWRARIGDRLVTDFALRRDSFNRFKDATTLRASGLLRLAPSLDFALSYGEGIAQPSFYDLYGYFPGFFTGNPLLRPERSRGVEGSLRFHRGSASAALTLYRQRLRDEIATLFFPTYTAVNVDGVSKREGAEVELGWNPSAALRVTANYSLLDASEPSFAGGQLRELRRPKHSGSLAIDGQAGRLSYGASLAFVGSHRDRLDRFPYGLTTLDSYWLGNGRVAYSLASGVEAFIRVANGFDRSYADVAGYRTEGRTAYAGIRLARGR